MIHAVFGFFAAIGLLLILDDILRWVRRARTPRMWFIFEHETVHDGGDEGVWWVRHEHAYAISRWGTRGAARSAAALAMRRCDRRRKQAIDKDGAFS